MYKCFNWIIEQSDFHSIIDFPINMVLSSNSQQQPKKSPPTTDEYSFKL